MIIIIGIIIMYKIMIKKRFRLRWLFWCTNKWWYSIDRVLDRWVKLWFRIWL